MIDLGDALNKVDEIALRADCGPVLREKLHADRRDKLLERPSTAKPPAQVKGGTPSMMVLSGRDVGEICIADLCEAVPLVHGVDGFGKLGAAGFVDTARVDPDVAIAVLSRNGACFPDLGRQLGVIPDGLREELRAIVRSQHRMMVDHLRPKQA